MINVLRFELLKSAFKSQYMSRFCKSADSGANSTNTITHGEGATSVTNTISATDLMQNIQGRSMFSKPAPPLEWPMLWHITINS